MMDGAKLSVKNISKSFMHGSVKTEVLKNIDITFDQHSSYAIIGASGVGKSTFLHLLAGLDAPTGGKVFFNDQNINAFTPAKTDQFRNQSLGLVFQEPYLIKELSVLENVMSKGLIAGKNKKECREQALKLLDAVGLSEKINSYPFTLSGGQQQRGALARALFGKPIFLLADEPTGNLDRQTGNKVVDLMLKMSKEQGFGLIVSSHDPYVRERMGEVYELREGKLEQQ